LDFAWELVAAARGLFRRPAFVVLSAVTLSAGIGLATTIFCVVDAVLLRPLPFRDPARLVAIWESDRASHTTFGEISYTTMLGWREHSQAFEAVAGMATANSGLLLAGVEPVRVQTRLVSGNFFSVLGVAPALGRAFSDEEDHPGGPRAVVLGHALWEERFHGDPGIVGRTVVLNDHTHVVVGVMARGFQYPEGAQAWVSVGPELPHLVSDPDVWWMVAVGRLKAGATRGAAALELTSLFQDFYRKSFDVQGYSAVVTPLGDAILGSSRPALNALLAAVGLVFLIACANVAGLALVRTMERSAELALRQALGASRVELARLVLAQCAILALLGGLGGLVAARLAMPFVVGLSPQDVPRLHEAVLNLRAIAFALAASGAAALVSGLAPMLLAANLPVEETLRRGSGRIVNGRRTLRAALVASEVAIALALLVSSGLLARSFVNLSRAPLGFEPRGVLSMPIELPVSRYPEMAELRTFDEALLGRIRALPGVESAAVVLLRPLSGTVGDDFPFIVEGQSQDEGTHNPLSNLEAVSTDYFRAMGIPLRGGRVFDANDTEGKPGVVVVGEAFVKRYFPGQDPIGRRIKMPMRGGPYNQAWLTVVGIVADVRYRELEKTRLDVYMSYLQAPERVEHLVVRSNASPATLLPELRTAVRAMDPALPVGDIVFMPDVVSAVLGSPRFATGLFTVFAAFAVLLAALGLHGLLAYSLSRRTREIGVRVALGAERRDVQRLVLLEAAFPVILGIAAGLCLSLAAARVVAALLYGVSTTDPAIFGVAPLLLSLIGLATSLLAARRATRVSPVTALRSE
jgi:putative ABC transport system permease protein